MGRRHRPPHKHPQQALHLVEPEPKRHLVALELIRQLAGTKLLLQELVAEVRFLIGQCTEKSVIVPLVKHLEEQCTTKIIPQSNMKC